MEATYDSIVVDHWILDAIWLPPHSSKALKLVYANDSINMFDDITLNHLELENVHEKETQEECCRQGKSTMQEKEGHRDPKRNKKL